MFRLAVLVAVIIIGYITVQYIQALKPQQRKIFAAKAAAVALITILILLTVTGKLYILAALGTGLLIFAKRLFPLLRYFPFLKGLYQKAKATQSSDTSKRSTVETSLLKMTLDHQSGNLDGELLATDGKGKYLSELSLSELISLYGLADKQYPDSIEVLAAYLDRQHGSDWREAANAGHYSEESEQHARPSDSPEMTASEAYAVLGLDQTATEQDVIAAYRKLMQKLHSDRGGSNYLAAKINQAKDLLVSRKGK
ncbi:DnaJ domain-containing protein [Shewanella psychromarinicola]|uniref:Molecular chaperone DnaJ n=1 Tax=Shewanella psychromarinicola TaxID=2487742 RepID=A0A3N4DKI5_9GAMM|nr:DnaJ domain-containing protein [Shewanella psychromarinicola]AZG36213.1 molecular chaperone DnaJ [Shewanella psychromarinicola]MCL1083829.1 DnaJ domain-containing protein [Shewanella psychromarinicola]RPA22711.1 molecular chaperone DnaJ [Shewanella psychromarinicola]